jgi:uroporphyrinogen-III synthase
MSRELARLVEKHGGEPRCVPTVRECPEVSAPEIDQLVTDLEAGAWNVVVFPTGVAVALVFEMADELGKRPELVSALRGVTTVCRGPKPTAALRGFGVLPTLTARESFTSAELLDALATIDVGRRHVLLFCCGERHETLAETLIARGAELSERWLYRWRLPEDTSDMERLVDELVAGSIDGIAITCQIQFRHLREVADRMGKARELVRALDERVVVGAVGPTCRAVLNAYGVRVRVQPEHPKMGPLVVSLMRHLHQRNPTIDGAPPHRVAATH